MYNPFPPVAAGAVGVLAVTGFHWMGLAMIAVLAILAGLVALRTVGMKNRSVAHEQ
ncbi:hypothetical protein GCM10022381_18170 [Leifsonia kafniensis]|uniref:Uncharacterized protein n=1 Tax=Leifsonia kafniensis TaxID=475957 RepID=A0ABP7KFP3_9MICO